VDGYRAHLLELGYSPLTAVHSLTAPGHLGRWMALWLGHADIRSTRPYIHADMTIKERALALTTPATVAPGRYEPADHILAYLDSLA